MKKRILSMLLAIMMTITILPTTAFAEEAMQAESDHIHDNLFEYSHYYTAITSATTSITEESFFYLTDDVALDGTLTVSSGWSYLCLNGHTLSLKSGVTGSVIKVESGAVLSICNCSSTDGVITGGNAVNGGGICNEGVVRIERNNTGKIVVTNNHASELGGGIYNGNSMLVASPFEVTGNTAGVNGGGLYFHYIPEANFYSCQITGDTWIINNSVSGKANNVCLEKGAYFSCDDKSEVTARIGITPAEAPTALEPLDVLTDSSECPQGACAWEGVFFADDPTLYSIKLEPYNSGGTEGRYKLYLERTPGVGDVLYPIQFDSNASGIPDPVSAPYLAGSTLPLKDTKISKPGAIFLGWECSADGEIYTGSYTIPRDFNDPNGITFTALWGYGISYHVNRGIDSAKYAMTEKSAYQAGETVVVSPREGYVLNKVYYNNSNESTFTETATPQSNGTHTFTMPANDVVIWVYSWSVVPTGTHIHDCDHAYCDGTWEDATLLNYSNQLKPSLTPGSTSYFVARKNFDPGPDSSEFAPTLSSGTATVYLCLNGYTINTVTVPSGVTMYICDCAETEGKINTLNNKSTVYVGAGTYKTIGPDTGEIHVYDEITLTDYKYTSSRIFRMMSADARIHFSGKPDNVTPIQVYPYAEGVFATGWDDSYGRLSNIVKSGDSKYTVESDGGNLIARKSPTFAVTYADPNGVTANGKYQVDKTEAVYGERVNITITPDSGYEVDSVTVVRTANNGTVIVYGTGNTRYFGMPGADATVRVTFKSCTVPVTGVSLDETNIALTVGNTNTLIATVEPAAATNKAVTWSSSDDTVAAVDSNGKVTAVAPGTATITATAADGSGVSAACTVTVNAVTHTITKADTENGTVTVDKTNAAAGDTVAITATPDEGYEVDTVAVYKTGDESSTVEVTDNKFTMPAHDVTVSVTFRLIHQHILCQTNGCTLDHNGDADGVGHDAVHFVPVSTQEDLQNAATSGGCVYLTGDIELTAPLTVSQNLSLCLNGYDLIYNGADSVIIVSNGKTLNITDCGSTGTITGSTGDYGAVQNGTGTFNLYAGTITGNKCGVYNSGTFNMFGGKITGNTGNGVWNIEDFYMNGGEISGNGGDGVHTTGFFTMNGGEISGNTGDGVYNPSTFTMNGGEISGNSGDGVYTTRIFTMNGGEISGNDRGVMYNDGTVSVSGAPVINGNTNGNFCDYQGGYYLTLSGALTDGAYIGVTLEEKFGEVAGPSLYDDTLPAAPGYIEYFHSDEGYGIYAEGDFIFVENYITEQPDAENNYMVKTNDDANAKFQWGTVTVETMTVVKGAEESGGPEPCSIEAEVEPTEVWYGTFDDVDGTWTTEEENYDYVLDIAIPVQKGDVIKFTPVGDVREVEIGIYDYYSELPFIYDEESGAYTYTATETEEFNPIAIASAAVSFKIEIVRNEFEPLDIQNEVYKTATLYTNGLDTGTYACQVTWDYLGTPDDPDDDWTATSDPVEYVKTYTVTVSANPGEGGTVNGGGNYTAGSTVTLTATPNEGYVVNTITVTKTASGDPVAVNNNKFTMPAANVTVTVTFREIVYTGTVSEEDGAMDNVTAGGLGEVAEEINKNIVLTVKVEAADANDTEQTAIKGQAGRRTLEFLDITLKDDGGNSVEVPQSTVLEIAIPFTVGNKQNITVYRHHNGTAAAFTALNTKPAADARTDATFYVDSANNCIYVYTDRFSTYAIGYTVPSPAPSGGSYTPTYAITVEKGENGTVKTDRSYASSGSMVTLTVIPDTGYALETLRVTDKNGKEVELTNKGDGKYTFKMPASKVTVKAAFAVENPFEDVSSDAYYYDAVLWAVKAGITNGTSATTFSPDNPCTRAQMATFLWRAAGSPDPVSKTCIFADVPADAYYATAVQWAYEQGITSGTSATTYSPDEPCTRGQMATFLWRNAGSRAPVSNTNQFADVPAVKYYAVAVQWAYEQKITSGTSATTFSPNDPCTRAQMVTFLYRYYVK